VTFYFPSISLLQIVPRWRWYLRRQFGGHLISLLRGEDADKNEDIVTGGALAAHSLNVAAAVAVAARLVSAVAAGVGLFI
jgi:hypothetical protein